MRVLCEETKALRGELIAKKMGAKLNLSSRGTGIPCNDKRAHARVVSILAYHLVAKNYQFST